MCNERDSGAGDLVKTFPHIGFDDEIGLAGLIFDGNECDPASCSWELDAFKPIPLLEQPFHSLLISKRPPAEHEAG